MKKFIYLPLIAIVVLASCKSNSFTTQRYTKFGHKSHKASTHESVTVKETKAQPVEKVETEVVVSNTETESTSKTPIQLVASGIASLKHAIVKPERRSFASASAVNTSDEFSKDETMNSDNSTTVVKSQKNVGQKANSARGLIGDAFETAIWIVLVVIFVCLIIFLLSVIF